ncbi:EAL and HDOD domain-containing protein [Geobacter sp. SVR]|uniref:EAL and HDOD domain-containing protein n=1 Tax=Geobacter sp. SVR TaxID=2495594 RepID=UPI00143EF7F6|nr:EAL domain-containing protein [Geobacter sp. SVR]BCS53533.1 cyclic diguanylate phosphodiesterase [Geobacter sp. SVR]GCF84270.1 cyclic diguanylate phosphodiesterase [Geobacter sp. SVR]
MASFTEYCHMGRQPIFDRDGLIVAFELLFRTSGQEEARIGDASRATAEVIVNTLSRFGLNGILNDKQGFINVDADLLMSDSMSLLPNDRIVIELLETVEPDAGVVDRCVQLAREGFTIALDDHVFREDYAEIYDVTGIVKLDVRALSRGELTEQVDILKKRPVRLVAEKIETEDEFQWCRSLGFDLFQGYYFARPVVLKKKSAALSGAVLLDLFRQVASDAETEQIEKIVKGNPGLSYGLLQLVNSVTFGMRAKIGTVRHAISILGRRQLRRWVQLAVFAGHDEQGEENPLLDIAGWRARFMEVAAGRHPQLAHDPDAPGSAFLTGILSVLDRMHDLPMSVVVEELNLHERVRMALLSREGAIGEIMRLAEAVERCDFRTADRIAAACGLGAALLEDEIEASLWRQSMGTPPSRCTHPPGESSC